MNTKLFFASDHNGIQLRNNLILQASTLDILVEDLGIIAGSSLDYVDITNILAKRMASEKNCFGVLICGSGIGVSIAANRYEHLRAALCRSGEDAVLARRQNNANILCLGAKFCNEDIAFKCLINFVKTEFNFDKHGVCLKKIAQ